MKEMFIELVNNRRQFITRVGEVCPFNKKHHHFQRRTLLGSYNNISTCCIMACNIMKTHFSFTQDHDRENNFAPHDLHYYTNNMSGKIACFCKA